MVAGVLLTGGASRRLGSDKARLVLPSGLSLAARAAAVLPAVCDPVVEVGPGYSGLRTTREEPSGAGPLAGLVAGAAATGRQALLLLAVDLPRVEPPLLRLLVERAGTGVCVPEAGGRRQWACATYGIAAIAAAGRLVDAGERSLRALAREVEVDVVAEAEWRAVAPPDALVDVDTAADARRLGLTAPG